MNTFDLIINLVVRNQESIKSIGKDLKAIESTQSAVSKLASPNFSIPELTIANAFKFGKLVSDISPITAGISNYLGPKLLDGLIDATGQLQKMAQAVSEVGTAPIAANFDPQSSIEQSFARATQAAKGLSQEVGDDLSRSAKASSDSIDRVTDSLSRVNGAANGSPTSGTSTSTAPPQITFSPQTLEDTVKLFDVIKATYGVTTQLSDALDKAGGSRSGQINAIAQALTGVSKLISDIYGVSINLNDKEVKAIATSVVGLVEPLKAVGVAAIAFKDSISMAGLDPAKWVAPYNNAVKDLAVVLTGVGKVAIELKKNLTAADGNASLILNLVDLKDLQAGLGSAAQKANDFKKSFDLKDIPGTILSTAKAADELARAVLAISNGQNIFAGQGGINPFETLKATIGQVVERYKELQGVKLPPLNSKDAVQFAQALGITSDKAKQLQQDLNLQPQAIVTALNELNKFASVNLPLREQFKILNAEMGITRSQFSKLRDIQSGQPEKDANAKIPPQLEPIASKAVDFGLGKVNGDAQVLFQTLGTVAAKLEEVKTASAFKPLPTNEAVAFAQSLGVTATQARSLQKDLNLPTGTITSALNSIKQFESVKLPLKEQFQSLNQELGITKEQFNQIKKLKDAPAEDKTGLGLVKTFDSVSKLAFAYNNVETAVGSLVAKVNPAYAAMIGANERLNQQLLQSAASITATSAVSGADGAQLKNIDSIRALQPKLKETIREVEIATQSLVGVTSQQTSEVFNTILQNTGALNGQLKEAGGSAEKFKDPLDASAKLAPGLVATLGTLQIPLAQASQEINSLLKGEIDQNAAVAKSLGITRQMVETWKSQGTLVDNLTKKFDPFLKANAEAARSVGGITSNIQDMFEILNREAGKPVTSVYVDALEGVYKYLQGVMPAIQAVFTSVVQQQVTAIKAIAGSLAPLFNGVMTAVTAIAPMIEPAIRSSLAIITNLFKTLEPVFNGIGEIVGEIGKAFAAMLPFIIQANAIFGVLASTTFNIGIALAALGAPLSLLVSGIKAIAGAIESIAKDPLGGILIQAVGLTIALAPLVNTLLSFGAVVASVGGFFAWLPGAIAGFQTLVIVASSFLPFGGAISAALSSAAIAVNSFFAAIVAGAKPPVFIEFLKGAIVEIGLMAKTMLAQAIPATIALAKELGTFALQIIPRVVAGFAAMQTGGITAGFAALSAGLPILSGGFASVAAATNLAAAAAAKLLLAYGPLLVVVAAAGVTLLAKSAKDLADVNQELEDVSKTNNDISDSVFKTTERLKKLQDAQAKGGLTAEQKAELKDALFTGKQQISLIDDQIAANKKLRDDSRNKGASEEQLGNFDKLIEQKEREKASLSKFADAVKIASKELEILGTTNTQIAQKVKAAQGIIDGGVGDPAKFKESAKLLSDLTQKQVELGVVTAEEGAKTLAKLQNNTKLDYESQLAAKEAIVKIYQSRFAKIEELQAGGTLSNDAAVAELEQVRSNSDLQFKTRQEAAKKIIALNKETLDAELAELGAQTAKIEAQKAGGGIGEAEAAKQISEVKIKESTKRMEQLRKEAELETNPEVKRKLIADTEKAEAEITKIKADEQNRRNAERLKDFDEQAKVAQAELDKGATTEEAFNEKKRSIDVAQSAEQISQLKEKLGKLKSTDKEGREAIEAQIAEAESKREQNLKAANDREIATLQSKLDKELALVKAAESEKQLAIAQAVKGGQLSREQGDIEAAKAAAESAEKAIEAEEKKLDKLRSLPSPNNPKDAEALAKQIADQEGKFADSKLALLKKNGEIEKALVAEIAKANQRAGEEIDAAQQSNKVKLNQQEIEQLKANGADVEKIARAVAKSELDTERLAATEKFNLKQEELAKLKALIESGQISGPDAIDAERKLQKELADINLQRISLEKKALEELRAEKVRQIELDSQNSLTPLQKRVDLLNEQKSILEQQNSLIAAQQKLESAVFGLAKQRLGFAIEDAKNSQNEGLAKQLEAQAAGEQLAFTRQQNASKIEAIQLSIEQRAIDTATAQIQAEIATIQAKANLEKAIAEGKSKEQLDALRREVELRGRGEQLLAKSAENQKAIGQKELKAAAIENQTTEERAIRDFNKASAANGGGTIDPQAQLRQPTAPATPTTPVDPAKTATDLDASTKKVGASLEGTGNAIVEFGNKLRAITAIPSRFTGGPIGAGADFFGAEQGPELAQYGDGTFDLLMRPGIYNLKQGANIIPAQKTQEMIQASALMGGGGNISLIGAVGSGISTLIGGEAIVGELRRLQSIVSSRKPQMNIPVTFSEPSSDGTDRKMAEFSRMLVRSGL